MVTAEQIIAAAADAIEAAGGSVELAASLERLGRPILPVTIRSWKMRGIPPEWVPWVAVATRLDRNAVRPGFEPANAEM